jgi:hypothetical protein
MVTLTRDDPDYEPGIPLAAFLFKKKSHSLEEGLFSFDSSVSFAVSLRKNPKDLIIICSYSIAGVLVSN